MGHSLSELCDLREAAGEPGDRQTWGDRHAPGLRARPVAYFSMEYGLHASLPIYSGGLGVLAGDHLKSASDLGVPLIAVGLLYREGYFQQALDADGWQREAYPPVEPERQPLIPHDVVVRVETGEGPLCARVWEARVGRVRLFLLDADVEDNDPADRTLTARLYGGDSRTRIRQELLLGVGGARALRALGIEPGVLHMNEGHCAFATLELARQRMQDEGVDFATAARRVARRAVFTTHTPVPAGHDRFDPSLLEAQLGLLRRQLGLDADALLALGREDATDASETFCMTVLGIRMADRRNGVSSLHGDVTRRMWNGLFADRSEDRVPIGHVTNGVHLPTWMSKPIRSLLEDALGEDWLSHHAEPAAWAGAEALDGEALWGAHQQCKRELIAFVRERAAAAARDRAEPAHVVDALAAALSEDVLLVGFARRFATYKRAALVLSDEDRLDALVNDPERPVRFVFAGKAHPRDDGGKELIQRIHRVTRDPRFLGKVLLLEGYDMDVGRRLTSGVDLWLNTPRRPLEASGTSGQKAALNGVLNCSVLDGWWAEAWDGLNGFSIGHGRAHENPERQDAQDRADLMQVLGDEVLPLYYERPGALPHGWIERMRRSLSTLGWRFCADRMVRDYVTLGYMPAAGTVTAEMPA